MTDTSATSARQPLPKYRATVMTWPWLGAACAIIVVFLFAAAPAWLNRSLVQDMISVFYMLALAQCWNLLAGYSGLVSVGQQAFVGLGGYLIFALTLLAPLDPLIAILLTAPICAIIAVPTAMVVFRLRGAYFAIGSWVVAEVYRLVLAQFKQFFGCTCTSLQTYVINEFAGI